MLPRLLALAPLAPLVVLLGCPQSTDDPNPADPSELSPPAKGQGVQLVTADISVPSGVEEQDCYFFKVSELAAANGVPSDKPLNVHRIVAAQRKGSHHMNIFRVRSIVNLDPAKGRVQTGKNGVGECFKSANWADWPLVANSQKDGAIDWTYPDGVANSLQPDEWLMLQTHWVNASTQQTPTAYGKVRVNLFSIPDDQVKYQLGTLFATKQSIRVCRSNPHPSFDGTCHIDAKQPVHVIGANGHFHSRGTTFDIFAWDGTSTSADPRAKFYHSDTWSDPPMLTSSALDVTIQPGGGIWYSCDYDWVPPDPSIGCSGLDAYDQSKYGTPATSLDCCYTFGPIVEKNEHCNAFVYYWPKADNVTCF